MEEDDLIHETPVVTDDSLTATLSLSPVAATISEDDQASQIALLEETVTVDEEDLATPDGDMAFQLQIEEAIAASVDGEVVRFKKERQFGADIHDMSEHDWKVASEISEIPEEEWKRTGDDYHRPYYYGSSSAIQGGDLGFYEQSNAQFSLYFTGLVVEVDKKMKLGSVAVVIFDSGNAVVFKASKALNLPETEMRDEVAQLHAFLHGLEYGLSLQLTNVDYSCIDFDFDYLLNANEEAMEAKVAELVKTALLLKRKFQQCNSSAPTKSKAEIVVKLARSLIEKQAGKSFDELTIVKETCPICLEEVDPKVMFEIANCLHRICNSCLKNHIEHKVRERELPHCPELDCRSDLPADSCRRLVTQHTCDVIDQLVKESLIPVAEKVYCPNPKCSNLMSKAEALANAGTEPGFGACGKCRTKLCVTCKAEWHSKLSCYTYEKMKLNSGDVKLKQLAGDEKWRQCPLCSHMVELAVGCNHIYCRCGHQFCYLCGNEWKEKKATCSCPLWSEDKIIYGGAANLL